MIRSDQARGNRQFWSIIKLKPMRPFILLLLLPVLAFSQQPDSLPKTKNLEAVVVKGRKPFVERQVDKTVLNLQQDLVASSGTVFEALRRAPGLAILNEETLSMSGKSGVQVLIDGRPTQLSDKDLAAYLKSLPASMVDKIEIITNPSSRYDAQGNAGIINIRLKKQVARGTNGNLSTAFTQSNHPNYNLSGDLNHREGKWNFYGNLAGRISRQNTDGFIHRSVSDADGSKTFLNQTVDQDASKNLNFRAGADWHLNKQSTLGVMVKGNEYWSSLFTPGTTLIQTMDLTDSSLRTINDNRQRSSRYNYNLNYQFEDSTGNAFSVDADYTGFRNHSSGRVSTDLLDHEFNKYGDTRNNQDVLTMIRLYGLKTDLTRQLKNLHGKLESGLKWTTTATDNDLQAFAAAGGPALPDTGRTNLFHYRESILAAYTSFSRQVNKWEYQIGLRLEQSVIKGNSTDLRKNNQTYPDTAYLNLFPTAFLRYKASEKNGFALSYSRRINRPTYQDLNPFEYFFDNYSREKGNPFLQPEYSHTIEFSWTYLNALNLSAGYSRITNSIQGITSQRGDIAIATNYNLGRENRFFLNLSLPYPFTKWWESYTNLSPFYKEYTGLLPEGKLSRSTWGMNWYMNHSFQLPAAWSLQLSTWGNLATRESMARNASLGSLDFGAGKKLLKDKMQLRLTVTDILNTQRWKQRVQFGQLDYTYQRKWESRSIRLQLSWKLGKTNDQARSRELGSQDQINRIR